MHRRRKAGHGGLDVRYGGAGIDVRRRDAPYPPEGELREAQSRLRDLDGPGAITPAPALSMWRRRSTFGRRLRAAGVSFEDRQDLLGYALGANHHALLCCRALD